MPPFLVAAVVPARLTLAAAAVLLACNAQAQQAPGNTNTVTTTAAEPAVALEPVQKIEIKGGAASYDPRRDDTASKIVVNSEEIQKYGDTSIMDVFKRLPGITVSGAAGRGNGEVRMRGLGAGYTQILLNGERAPAGFSLDSLSPDVIERIEILRAASAEFSTQSIAGTINVVLKKAIKTAQREVKATLAGGKSGISPNVSLLLSNRAGNFSYSMSGTFYRGTYEYDNPVRETGFDTAGRQTLRRSDSNDGDGRYQGFNMAPRLNWTLAGGDTLTAQLFANVGNSSGDNVSVTDTSLGARPQYDQDGSRSESHNGFGRGDLTWVRKLDGGARLELKGGLNASGNSSDSRQSGSVTGRGLALDRAVAASSTERGFSSTGKYATPLFDGHALAMGWDGGHNARDDQRRQRDAVLAGGVAENTDEGFDASVDRLALYGQDEWSVTPRWSVYAGLRWEGLATRSAGDTYDAVRQRTSVWSPLLQTLWKLPDTKGDQVRFALTRTFKATPTASLIPRRFTSLNNSQTEPDRQGNPNLKPELALGFDTSYEHYWGEGALLSASASMRRIDGYTRQGLLFQGQRWLSTPVNDGRAVTRGLELEAKFPLKTVMDQAPAVDLRASLSRNWSRVEAVPGPDNRLAQQTPFSANLGVDYKTPGGALSTGGNFSFKNAGPVRITDSQRASGGPRRELDVYALWKFNPKNQLRLALSNLLQQDTVSETAYSDASGTLLRNDTGNTQLQARATMEMKF